MCAGSRFPPCSSFLCNKKYEKKCLERNQTIYADIDLERLECERRRMTTYQTEGREDYRFVSFTLDRKPLALERAIDPTPFVPHDAGSRNRRCEEILSIQAMGLKKRLKHTGCRHAVVGISGGLDSTGMKIFEIGEKYYFEDLGLHNSIQHFDFRKDINKLIDRKSVV